MLPIEFDHQVLSNIPSPSEHGAKRVMEVLGTMVAQRIVPYFRNRKGTDLIQLARVKQSLSLHRMEDESGLIRLVSLVSSSDHHCLIRIHASVLDYMASVIPLKPELSMGDADLDERKILTFAEFLLRHDFEHLLNPQRREHEIIHSDIDFAMGWRQNDPTAYQMLRSVLADSANGIDGSAYLDLLDLAERGRHHEIAIERIVSRYAVALGDMPEALIEEVFHDLESGIKSRVVEECYRKSRSTSYSLMKRASNFRTILRLLFIEIHENRETAMEIFNALKHRWGLVGLFHELDLPETEVEGKETEELFDLLRTTLEKLSDLRGPAASSPITSHFPSPAAPAQAPDPAPGDLHRPPKSLKERIEEARTDPVFPQPAMELIDKNRQNAAGQSGAKYTELIETLLAIPWGVIRKIRVSPAEFEQGLNRSHYGLAKPKEILCDFFTNLIWRYQHFREEEGSSWKHNGSAFLFVGPPGVGKTSLAVSVAENLQIPSHKISLAGMRDEADIRGYGFTYEGSKPGPIVQGLIKMGALNGVFILDEADKTEKFAIATLLEILDPEQNHLFHDKYTQTTIDIDLSNCHFILTANTIETVPTAVLDRCEVIFLDRYSVEEKIAIAREYLIRRVRRKYMIGENEIFFDSSDKNSLLRTLIKNYTFEAGVRDFERVLRTLFLRIHRKEILDRGMESVRITQEKIREYLEEPERPRRINEDDRVGEMMGLGVNMELGVGALIPVQVTPLSIRREKGNGWPGTMSIAHATGNLERVMDESRKVASTAISHCAGELGIDMDRMEDPVHLHFMGGSTRKDGPSAGGPIALALASFFLGKKIRRDVAMTGEIDTQGRITGIGGLDVKLETAYTAGCKTMIIPRENMQGTGGIGRLPDALKQELQILDFKDWKTPRAPFDYTRHMLQVVAVDHILQAAEVAFIEESELNGIEELFLSHARRAIEDSGADHAASVRNIKVIYLDDPSGPDPELFGPRLCEEESGCILLVKNEARTAAAARLPGLEGRIDLRSFDPARDNLTDVVGNIRSSFPNSSGLPLRLSLIAPLSFLERDGIRADAFPTDSVFEGLRIFCSCCTVENVFITDCSSILNRAYHHLSRLKPAALDECPFLIRKDTRYMVSLSSIPEKYRLDVQRCEEILHRCLTRWLSLL